MKKILFIDPGEVDLNLNNKLAAFLNTHKGGSIAQVDVVGLPQTPHHLEYYYYHALIAPSIIEAVYNGERAGYDACVIGCFDDPCLDAAREICDKMVVTAPMEACIYTAMTLGSRFSVLVGHSSWIPRMQQHITYYGGAGKLASFVDLGLGVTEFQQDPAHTEKLMRQAVETAIQRDRAEVIILGCTMEFGFYRQLQEIYSIPILDATLVPLKYAEYLLELQCCCSWFTSKGGAWATPPKGELRAWGLQDKYGIDF